MTIGKHKYIMKITKTEKKSSIAIWDVHIFVCYKNKACHLTMYWTKGIKFIVYNCCAYEKKKIYNQDMIWDMQRDAVILYNQYKYLLNFESMHIAFSVYVIRANNFYHINSFNKDISICFGIWGTNYDDDNDVMQLTTHPVEEDKISISY